MCQTNSKLVELKKDKVVYKVEELIDGKWLTFVQGVELERNCIIEALGEPELYQGDEIYHGFFHCQINVENAINYVKSFMNYLPTRIVKVIIPHKNNIIYSGEFWKKKSICARNIILTDEVVWELMSK